ncbi:MerR family transcriptional regulator [Campylobacter sp. MIT 12-5580]|uniref:MerR family transcriptional regulator n=1 Tax=Campylobacter sp. MIT 12-5580 TaxID=2040651 RepID=UPI0010F847BB|nr:MerR family transcriptional regulator [Campylobacter sp. MIT 12-5580]TKX29606.1 MerR family transcriptional regulator [Campylobacter sp. MIT 12-5580]
MAYTIAQVAKQTGITPYTLRFWVTKGLFPFVERDHNGVKYFSKKDIEWVLWIECLRSMDMSLEDIKAYIYLTTKGVASASARKNLLTKQRAKVVSQLAKLQKGLQRLEKKIVVYENMELTGEDLLDPNNKHYQSVRDFYTSETQEKLELKEPKQKAHA